MVLQGFQFDRMAVTPEADATLFHVLNRRNNTVVDGYKNGLAVTSSGLNVIVATGAAVIYGRLITNVTEERISVQANKSGYVVLTVDLTAVNTSTGVPGTIDYRAVNNQIRLEVVDTLNQQNLFNGGYIHTFPLARYASTGSTVTVTKIDGNYNQGVKLMFNSSAGGNNMVIDSEQKAILIRDRTKILGNVVTFNDDSTFTVNESGVYEFHLSTSRSELNSSDWYTIFLSTSKNKTIVSEWATGEARLGAGGTIPANQHKIPATLQGIVELDAGETVRFMVNSKDGPRTYFNTRWYLKKLE